MALSSFSWNPGVLESQQIDVGLGLEAEDSLHPRYPWHLGSKISLELGLGQGWLRVMQEALGRAKNGGCPPVP